MSCDKNDRTPRPVDLLAHDWGGVVRVCQQCNLMTSPEAIEQAERDADLRDAALEEAAKMLLGGRFLHEDAPAARLAKEAAKAIRAMKRKDAGESP